MRKKIYLIFFLFFMLSHLLTLYGQDEQKNLAKEYTLGSMDLLEINVFELPQLNQTVRVSEDGSITLPLLGKVVLGGLTKDAAERKLVNLLNEKYTNDAKVSVFVREYQSRLIAVIGAVKIPGLYKLIGRRTLLQMISQAGGFTENAGNKLSVLREGEDGATENITIDLEELLKNGNQSLNIPLEADDVINVQVDEIIRVFVFGMVKSPGALEVKMSKKITLLQAIAQAGGLEDEAKQSGILIKRRNSDGNIIKIKANLKDIIDDKRPDIELKEGDVVYVPESIW